MESFKKLLLIFVALATSACTNPPAEQVAPAQAVSEEQNVNPGINRNYKKADLNADVWAVRFTGESREVFVKREDILAALELQPGDRVADIGAGTGLYVKLFAEAVGEDGKVYANDIAPNFLKFIAENAAKDGLTNVVTVLGGDKSSGLSENSVDVVFHSDVYHHFEYPLTMNRDLARALTEDGVMYVLDFERIEGVSPGWILQHVRAGKETVVAEIEASGFELEEEIDIEGLEENYLLRFRKK